MFPHVEKTKLFVSRKINNNEQTRMFTHVEKTKLFGRRHNINN